MKNKLVKQTRFELKKSQQKLLKKINNFSKLVVPENPYMKEHPKRKKPDEKAPKIKYFKPDSMENSDCLLKQQSI